MKKNYILITLITLFAMAQLPGFAQDWSIQTIDQSADIRDTHIKLDNNSYPHVVYKADEGTPNYFYYAKWTGIAWEIEKITSNNYAGHAKFCLDQNNDPHIIHMSTYSSDLIIYTYRNASGALAHNSIANGNYDIIAVYFRNGILEFIGEYNGNMYQFIYNTSNNTFAQTNVGILEAGSDFESALDDDGNVYFAYYSSGNIRFGFFDGTNVSSFHVADNGQLPSITLDNQDIPHISFYKTDTDDLIHAKLPAQAVKYLKSLKDKNVQTANSATE